MTLTLVILLLMSAAGRIHGIGGIPGGRIFSTAIIGFGFALGGVALYGPWGAVGGALSAWAFCWGHGNFYAMDGSNPAGNGPEAIETYFARPIWLFFGGDILTPAYSWWCMGLKWLAIGAAVLPYGVAIAVFAPAAYTVSFRYTTSSALAEWLTTIFAGLVIANLCAIHFNELVAVYQLGAGYVGVSLD